MKSDSFAKFALLPFSLLPALVLLLPVKGWAVQTDIAGPSGSGAFGTAVAVLPNGNIIVTDPLFDAPGPVADVGAVYLYSPTGTLISTLTGSTANDQIGNAGITVLSNGNYVVRSTLWDGAATDVGAVTWCNGVAGRAGIVAATNSLVGSTASDQVGNGGVEPLANGNYVVRSTLWDGAAVNVGAVTWCNGVTGRTGIVAAANSLIGSTASDQIGNAGVLPLANGNYVVRSTLWDGAAVNVGAVTWGSGTTGITGTVSSANSLVGSTASDSVGNFGVTALANGNYVVRSSSWDGVAMDTGAVTWGNGTTGIVGVVSSGNSLTSDRASALVGSGGVTALNNGNYVVGSPLWEIGVPGFTDIGAATWCDGSIGRVGLVTAGNSLIGSTGSDNVGSGIVALSDGNYVVNNPNWDNGSSVDAGAATWCDGTTGYVGTQSAGNSLVGSLSFNNVGNSIVPLLNGKYVVNSPGWDDIGSFGPGKGAVTFCGNPGSRVGVVSTANSLTGRGSTLATDQHRIGSGGVIALTNGNYAVSSPVWEDAIPVTPQDPFDAGAVTWCSGIAGGYGTVVIGNSLFGSSQNDGIGNITALANGNYLVGASSWNNGFVTNAGAITWCNGNAATIGAVTSANSLHGSTLDDSVGGNITALRDGNYAVYSRFWDNGGLVDAGAVSLCLGAGGTVGPINANNSVLGTVASGGANLVFDYDPARQRLVVGRRNSNLGSLFSYLNSSLAVPFSANGLTMLSNGSFRFAFTNLSGVTFTVLTSTNAALPLNNWTVLGSVPEISAGQFQFTDTQASNNVQRFYRVRSP